ncbi:MAG TPA: hypothetical protein VNK05_11125 [Chloroflexota bacterium]|nr:hypothetical protein [Chloroflexota bacterium]
MDLEPPPAVPRIRPRDRTDRALAALAHGAGLLGLTVAGWLAALLVSVPLLFVAGPRRSPYLAAHAGQAALYQTAVAVLQLAYLLWLGAGFLTFGGAIPGVPDYRVFDYLVDPWLTAVQVIWGLSVLVWPVFYLSTAGLAALGAVRAYRGQRFWYPLVSGRIRRLAEGPERAPDEEPDEEPEREEGPTPAL